MKLHIHLLNQKLLVHLIDVQEVPIFQRLNRMVGLLLDNGKIGEVGKKFLIGTSVATLGKEAAKLATQLGYYARQGNLFPVNVKSWNKMEKTRLDDIWEIVKKNTNAPDGYKNICLEKIGIAWKRHKSSLKQKYYASKNTEEEQLENVPPAVEPSQWKDLVTDWSTEESKAISDRNKKNREKLFAYPRTGRTSFSVIAEEMKEKNLQVDKLGIFRYTRQKNNQYCEDDGAADLEDAIKQKLDALPIDKQSDEEEKIKIFREVVGQDGHGRSLCMGTSTKHVKGSYNKVAEEEVVFLNEKIDVQKELIENQQKKPSRAIGKCRKRHNEQIKNLDKRHRQEMTKFYKVLQNAGFVNDDNDAFDNNQDTSDHFSDAR